MDLQRWTVGEYEITAIVEDETLHIPPEMFVGARDTDVARHTWLVPEFADARGRIAMRVQAFVIDGLGRRVLVDPCVGNGKQRPIPFWNERTFPFMERFIEAGFAPERIHTVVHTHLHADHVGWDTTLEGAEWRPTFTRARHLYTARELAWAQLGDNPGTAGVHADSIAPIFAAGLADVVPEDFDLGGGLRLEPTVGHTPGHVSLWLESAGESALISGDFIHHPVQCSELGWAETGDVDPDQARATRRRMLARAAETRALFLGTHFPSRPGGRIVAAGDAFRFEAL
jgi:glyoxylase-like metal-dependent hydrolase (beta-lactamase superfamily II)